jgi:hypothetical protein
MTLNDSQELEQVLFRNPDDLTAWRVYADWRGPKQSVGADAIEALASIDAPALRRFELWRAPEELLAAALDVMTTGRWANRLTGITLGPLPAEEADQVLKRLEPILSRGATVYLLVTGSRHDTPTLERLRQEEHPTVKLSGAYERRFTGSTPVLTEHPRLAPYDFRDLSPRVQAKPADASASWKSYSPVFHGSGWPLDNDEKVQRCLGCGSRDVLQIYKSGVVHYGSTTTDGYDAGELVCKDCGRFTSWEATWGY